jgi:hypothetical protein
MKLLATVFALFSLSLCIARCAGNDGNVETVNTVNPTINNPAVNKMIVTIGSAVFTAILTDNATTAALREILPLAITMEELNGNEKFYYFPGTLPSDASPGGNIQPGDLMLYGNNCLVLFYKGFSTSYSYTRIGHIDNVSGLAAALGTGNAMVRFKME